MFDHRSGEVGIVEGKGLGICVQIEMTVNIMRKRSARIFKAMLLGVLLVSCNSTHTVITPSNIQNLTTPSKAITSTEPPTFTTVPSTEFTLTPSPFPTTSEQATIVAFGALCTDPGEAFGSETETSPDGKWIATECISENGTEDSPLRVISIDRSKDWKIYYGDYANGTLYDHKDILVPYHWTKDGRFLYSTAGSRLSGCCWVGHRYTLLVRLNLETGEQVELLNSTDPGLAFPFDIKFSDSDRYLFFTAPTNQPYDLVILDLQTWKTKPVALKFSKDFDLYYAIISPGDEKIALPLYEYHEATFDFTLDAINLIDLKTNKQKLLISSLKQGEELYPIRWIDENQILLSSVNPDYSYSTALQGSAEYWLLNTQTSQLVKTEKP